MLSKLFMKNVTRSVLGIILLVSSLIICLLPVKDVKQVNAYANFLTWSVVDTPSALDNVVVSPSEINSVAVSSDNRTFYAVDIPSSIVYRSTDAGISWKDVTINLVNAGALLPIWSITTAPDDANFIIAVSDGTGGPGGPKAIFISQDGGNNWQNTAFPAIGAGEFISCIDISKLYGSNRDILAGTRDGAGGGGVYTLQAPSLSGWNPKTLNRDVYRAKFSPNYVSDSGIIAVASNDVVIPNDSTSVYIGIHTHPNTIWNVVPGFPVEVKNWNSVAGISPGVGEMITADLELPSNFQAQTGSLRRIYISTDADDSASPETGIFRLDDTTMYHIKDTSDRFSTMDERISSIAYIGDYDEGILLAGEVNVDLGLSTVEIWKTSNPISLSPTWFISNNIKSPTGGANTRYANAQLILVSVTSEGKDIMRAYCGTSSADPSVGGTAWAANTWPLAWITGSALDESAFSVSPYSDAYDYLLSTAGKTTDIEMGDIWNQLSLIDTEITLFSDTGVIEIPEDGQNYNILYIVSQNTNGAVINNFDSVWRSTSDPIGASWERILCTNTSDNGMIVRINPRTPEEDGNIKVRSEVITIADLFTSDFHYSTDEGQIWNSRNLTGNVTDLTLSNDQIMYVLDDNSVFKDTLSGTGLTWPPNTVFTKLDAGHTISTPMKNPISTSGEKEFEDWVIVGGATQGEASYADFSQSAPSFEITKPVPVAGNVHVIADELFSADYTIYAASHDIAGNLGKIYRWTINENTEWDLLQPPDNAFYGLAQRNNVLYGLWNVPAPANTRPGADRTLYPRAGPPPPIEWDDLTAGLPTAGDINFPVLFTREPSSLKISSDDENNTLWAIDNNNYDWANQTGCLWAYIDTIAKVGPWTTSPYSSEFVPGDTVTGRADELDFRWRQLLYAQSYQLQIAKDSEFSFIIADTDNITPADALSPAWILTPGLLESNHKYYWRVRARSAITGEIVRSLWSATMFFTVQGILPVTTPYLGPVLLNPENNCGCPCDAPIAFSWAPFANSEKYKFELSENADMTESLTAKEIIGTSYQYEGKLKCNTNYFWRVMAIEPVFSDWSATFSFSTKTNVTPSPTPILPKQTTIPFWIWPVIVVFTLLFTAIIFFIMTKPGYIKPETNPNSISASMTDSPRNPVSKVKNALIMKNRRRRHLSEPVPSELKQEITVNNEKTSNVDSSIINKMKKLLPAKTNIGRSSFQSMNINPLENITSTVNKTDKKINFAYSNIKINIRKLLYRLRSK
jgi:hypothetical protein